jgi:hypothetical protein
MKRRRNSPGFLPKAAQKWVDGSGAIVLVARQQALYVNFDLGPESAVHTYYERAMQKAVVQYIDKRYPAIGNLCFHVPLELLRRDDKSAGMFHALGARAGVADIVMLVPRGCYHGLVIELKVPRRRPTDNQCRFLESARANGYAACWSDSLNTVLKLIDVYLSLPPRAALAELSSNPVEQPNELSRRTESREADRPGTQSAVLARHEGAAGRGAAGARHR